MTRTRIFHVSDLHFGREDEEAIAWFSERVAAETPDAVVITGDLTMRARSAEYEAAGAWLATLGVPVTVEPGNHDLPYHNPIARMFWPYRRFDRIERAFEKPLDLPGLWLVPLKTTARAQWRLNWSWGVVSKRSLAEAVERLRLCPRGRLALVTCHHPLTDEGASEGHGETLRGIEALHTLAQAGADAVLSGHVHDPFDVMWNADGTPLRLIGAGTLSERLRTAAPSFNELTIENGALDVRVREMATA
ncbi:metallophosphoesterase family protein [Sphingomonas solaris]|uniref:Metallophosphoesterase n=1 Tax=Alterirhizorhabdus solaris TaxID=2529389 RepID=A0A558RBX4_9SPHN|nr:metallophosphoesterase [Sphingomonas solaris]TVV76850.1 metallophosphoesterase [Sphingomonas solaris]